MATYQALQQKIAGDLHRSDLTTQIQEAILAAVDFFEHERFWFNELRQTAAFNTVASQEFYSSSDSALIASMVEIEEVTITVSGWRYPLTRRTYAWLEAQAADTADTGQPCDYAHFSKQLRLYPIPDAVYAIALSGVRTFTALSAADDTDAWTTEAFELIRAQAKWDLQTNLLKDDQEAARMEKAVARQFQRLKAETARRSASGRLVPTQF